MCAGSVIGSRAAVVGLVSRTRVEAAAPAPASCDDLAAASSTKYAVADERGIDVGDVPAPRDLLRRVEVEKRSSTDTMTTVIAPASAIFTRSAAVSAPPARFSQGLDHRD
jgi:hypothetical protein